MHPDVTAFHKKPLLARLSTQPLKPGCSCRLNTLGQHFRGLVFRIKSLGSHSCCRKQTRFPFFFPFCLLPSGATPKPPTHRPQLCAARHIPFPGRGPPLASRLSPPPGSFSDFPLLAFSALGFAPSLFPLQPHPPPLLALLSSPPPPRTPPCGQHHGRHQSTCTDQISSLQSHNSPQEQASGCSEGRDVGVGKPVTCSRSHAVSDRTGPEPGWSGTKV